MKRIPQEHEKNTSKLSEQSPRPWILALMLTGILALEMHPTLTKNATANVKTPSAKLTWMTNGNLVQQLVSNLWVENTPSENSSPIAQKPATKSSSDSAIRAIGSVKTALTEIELPPGVREAVIQTWETLTKLTPNQVKITEAQMQTWPDSCLGLAQPEEFCAQMLVEGWKVVVTDATGKTWVFHTDDTGTLIRLKP